MRANPEYRDDQDERGELESQAPNSRDQMMKYFTSDATH